MIDLSTALLPPSKSARAIRLASPGASAFAVAMQSLASTGAGRIAMARPGDPRIVAAPVVMPVSTGAPTIPASTPVDEVAPDGEISVSDPPVAAPSGAAAQPCPQRHPSTGAQQATAAASRSMAQVTRHSAPRQAIAGAGSGLPDDATGSPPSDGGESTSDAGAHEEVSPDLVAYAWFPTSTPLPPEQMPVIKLPEGRSPIEAPQTRSLAAERARDLPFPAAPSGLPQAMGHEPPEAPIEGEAPSPAAPRDVIIPARGGAERLQVPPSAASGAADAPHAPDVPTPETAPIVLPSSVPRPHGPLPAAATNRAGERLAETEAAAPFIAAEELSAAPLAVDARARAISPPPAAAPKSAPPPPDPKLQPATATSMPVRGLPARSPAAVPARPTPPAQAPALVVPTGTEPGTAETPLASESLLPSRRTAPDGASAELAAAGARTDAPRPVGVNAPARVEHDTIDLRRHDWTGRMVDHIEALRDAAPSGETRIRLAPEMLGTVDIAIRQEGDRVHVQFTAESPAARQALSDAQSRLVELAEARGVRLGQTGVDGGAGQGNPGQRHDAPAQPTRPARAPLREEPTPTGDDRIA